MVTQATAPNNSIADLFRVVADDGPLTAGDIAARLSVSEPDARVCVRWMVNAGYAYRDEFGLISAWCPWPRVGLP